MTLEKLYDEILRSEAQMNGDIWRFWQLIKILPEAWTSKDAGLENRQSWVVAICGRNAIRYDESEEEFVITTYDQYGVIGQPYTQLHQLEEAVMALFSHIKHGGGLIN